VKAFGNSLETNGCDAWQVKQAQETVFLYTRFKSPMTAKPEHVKRFLTYLAVERKVTASTQNQDPNALLVLYREVLCRNYYNQTLIIGPGKGDSDRVTLPPGFLHGPLKRHLEAVKTVHAQDPAKGVRCCLGLAQK